MTRKPTADEIVVLEADGWKRDGNRWHAPLKYWGDGVKVLAAMTTKQAIKRIKQVYLYGAKSRVRDEVQHLIPPAGDHVALCGASEQWVFNRIRTTPLPGLVLCQDCRIKRADLQRAQQRDNVRFAWVRPQEATR